MSILQYILFQNSHSKMVAGPSSLIQAWTQQDPQEDDNLAFNIVERRYSKIVCSGRGRGRRWQRRCGCQPSRSSSGAMRVGSVRYPCWSSSDRAWATQGRKRGVIRAEDIFDHWSFLGGVGFILGDAGYKCSLLNVCGTKRWSKYPKNLMFSGKFSRRCILEMLL